MRDREVLSGRMDNIRLVHSASEIPLSDVVFLPERYLKKVVNALTC